MDHETEIELARHDERIKGLWRDIARSEQAQDKALTIAANELSRRLDILNHAHEDAQCARATYYSREMHDQFAQATDKRIAALERAMWMAVGAGAVAGTAAAVIVKLLKL